MLCLVTAKDPRRLRLGGSATGKFLVEVYNPLHPDGIGVRPKSLCNRELAPFHLFRAWVRISFVIDAEIALIPQPCSSGPSKLASDTPVANTLEENPYLRRRNLYINRLVVAQLATRF